MRRFPIEAEPCAELDDMIRRGAARVVRSEQTAPPPLLATETWAQALFFGEPQARRRCLRRAGSG